jgi:HPt (histidine-containing phosphotransfer) domain-containing protein
MASSPGDDLPRIPGIDQAELLDRIGGDEELYWELLRELSRGYRDFPQRIAQALDSDIDEATRIAHTLKGVLGNLAATQLHATSRDLHQAIRERDSSRWPGLLDAFSVQLAALCDAIDAASGSQPDTDTPAAEAAAPTAWLLERYAALAEALRGNRARECKSLIKEIAASDIPPSEAGQFTAIERLVKAYLFEDALRLVEDRLHE